MVEYSRNIFEFVGPTEPRDSVQVGNLWYNTTDNVVCQRETTGFWNCGAIGSGYTAHSNTSVDSRISKIVFPFSTGSSVKSSNINNIVSNANSFNSTSQGYICGGAAGDFSTTVYSYIDSINFFHDNIDAARLGSLSAARCWGPSFNSSQNGYVCAGYIGLSGTYQYTSVIDKLLFSIGTSALVGNTSSTQSGCCGCNSSLYGYSLFDYAYIGDQVYRTNIERINFATDTSSAVVGNTSATRFGAASVNSTLYGYFIGGGKNFSSNIESILFPFSSGTATVTSCFTPVSMLRSTGVNSTLHGYIVNGMNASSVNLSTISSLAFPFSSGIMSAVGISLVAEYTHTSFDNIDFVQQFI